MRITMKSLYATPKVTAQPGDTIDVPAKLGKELVERRYAVRAADDPAQGKTTKSTKAPADDQDDADDLGPDTGDGEDADTGTEGIDEGEPEKDADTNTAEVPDGEPETADTKATKKAKKGGK